MKTRKQLGQSRLSAAGFSDQRDHRALGDAETDVAQDRPRIILVTEGDAAEFNRPGERLQLNSVALFGNLAVLVHHVPDVTRRRQSLLHAVMQPRKLAHGIVAAEEKN